MSNDTTTAPTPFYDEGCRILTISASLAGGTAFIERLKALSGSEPASVHSSVPPPSGSSAPEESGFITVPYTLANRYYTADVHFAAYAMQALYPGLFAPDRRPDYKPPPAVVFVWVEGEPYEKHIEELSRMMAVGGYEPEVSLAVRIPKVSSAASTVTPAATTPTQTPTPIADAQSEFEGDHTNKNDNDNTETDRTITAVEGENADIDTTLMSFGFEYVDATRESAEAKPARTDAADGKMIVRLTDLIRTDIPHLPRVLDALSTIMWPSMQSRSAPTNSNPKAEAKASAVRRDWEYGSIVDELLSVSGISGISGADSRSRALGASRHQNVDEEDAEDVDTLFAPYDFTSTSNAHFFGVSSSSSAGERAAGTTGFVVREEEREDRAWLAADGPGVSMTTRISTTTIGATSGARADSAGMVTSPVDVDSDAMAPFGRRGGDNLGEGRSSEKGGQGRVEIGFEDDFTVFVSAPAETPARAWTPLDEGGPGFGEGLERGREGSLAMAGRLMPSSALARGLGSGRGRGRGTMAAYRSLGSVSDFGGDESDSGLEKDLDLERLRRGYRALGNGAGRADEDEDAEVWEDDAEDEVDESWVEYAEAEWDDEGDGDAEEDAEEEEDGEEEDEDEGMPTKDEIMAAAARIFGVVPRSLGGGGFRKASEVNRELDEESVGATSTAKSTVEDKDAFGGATASGAAEGVGASSNVADGSTGTGPSAPARAPNADLDDGDLSDAFDTRPFDVERVLHALQDFRSEIAGVTNEEQRRRIAARVALGFVYGMEADLRHGDGGGAGDVEGSHLV
ncbi:hypothetical protein BDZ97DRAFT_1759853 [Flammula alnicola]|nr:hypothetical protein BDZ97DRAFT_1759853 [Flammula alnicola]